MRGDSARHLAAEAVADEAAALKRGRRTLARALLHYIAPGYSQAGRPGEEIYTALLTAARKAKPCDERLPNWVRGHVVDVVAAVVREAEAYLEEALKRRAP